MGGGGGTVVASEGDRLVLGFEKVRRSTSIHLRGRDPWTRTRMAQGWVNVYSGTAPASVCVFFVFNFMTHEI